MRKVIVAKENQDSILLEDICESTPIFAKLNGKLYGMVVHERERGWILCIGGACGCSGYHATRRECIEDALSYSYTFFVE